MQPRTRAERRREAAAAAAASGAVADDAMQRDWAAQRERNEHTKIVEKFQERVSAIKGTEAVAVLEDDSELKQVAEKQLKALGQQMLAHGVQLPGPSTPKARSRSGSPSIPPPAAFVVDAQPAPPGPRGPAMFAPGGANANLFGQLREVQPKHAQTKPGVHGREIRLGLDFTEANAHQQAQCDFGGIGNLHIPSLVAPTSPPSTGVVDVASPTVALNAREATHQTRKNELMRRRLLPQNSVAQPSVVQARHRTEEHAEQSAKCDAEDVGAEFALGGAVGYAAAVYGSPERPHPSAHPSPQSPTACANFGRHAGQPPPPLQVTYSGVGEAAPTTKPVQTHLVHGHYHDVPHASRPEIQRPRLDDFQRDVIDSRMMPITFDPGGGGGCPLQPQHCTPSGSPPPHTHLPPRQPGPSPPNAHVEHHPPTDVASAAGDEHGLFAGLGRGSERKKELVRKQQQDEYKRFLQQQEMQQLQKQQVAASAIQSQVHPQQAPRFPQPMQHAPTIYGGCAHAGPTQEWPGMQQMQPMHQHQCVLPTQRMLPTNGGCFPGMQQERIGQYGVQVAPAYAPMGPQAQMVAQAPAGCCGGDGAVQIAHRCDPMGAQVQMVAQAPAGCCGGGGAQSACLLATACGAVNPSGGARIVPVSEIGARHGDVQEERRKKQDEMKRVLDQQIAERNQKKALEEQRRREEDELEFQRLRKDAALERQRIENEKKREADKKMAIMEENRVAVKTAMSPTGVRRGEQEGSPKVYGQMDANAPGQQEIFSAPPNRDDTCGTPSAAPHAAPADLFGERPCNTAAYPQPFDGIGIINPQQVATSSFPPPAQNMFQGMIGHQQEMYRQQQEALGKLQDEADKLRQESAEAKQNVLDLKARQLRDKEHEVRKLQKKLYRRMLLQGGGAAAEFVPSEFDDTSPNGSADSSNAAGGSRKIKYWSKYEVEQTVGAPTATVGTGKELVSKCEKPIHQCPASAGRLKHSTDLVIPEPLGDEETSNALCLSDGWTVAQLPWLEAAALKEVPDQHAPGHGCNVDVQEKAVGNADGLSDSQFDESWRRIQDESVDQNVCAGSCSLPAERAVLRPDDSLDLCQSTLFGESLNADSKLVHVDGAAQTWRPGVKNVGLGSTVSARYLGSVDETAPVSRRTDCDVSIELQESFSSNVVGVRSPGAKPNMSLRSSSASSTSVPPKRLECDTGIAENSKFASNPLAVLEATVCAIRQARGEVATCPVVGLSKPLPPLDEKEQRGLEDSSGDANFHGTDESVPSLDSTVCVPSRVPRFILVDAPKQVTQTDTLDVGQFPVAELRSESLNNPGAVDVAALGTVKFPNDPLCGDLDSSVKPPAVKPGLFDTHASEDSMAMTSTSGFLAGLARYLDEPPGVVSGPYPVISRRKSSDETDRRYTSDSFCTMTSSEPDHFEAFLARLNSDTDAVPSAVGNAKEPTTQDVATTSHRPCNSSCSASLNFSVSRSSDTSGGAGRDDLRTGSPVLKAAAASVLRPSSSESRPSSGGRFATGIANFGTASSLDGYPPRASSRPSSGLSLMDLRKLRGKPKTVEDVTLQGEAVVDGFLVAPGISLNATVGSQGHPAGSRSG